MSICGSYVLQPEEMEILGQLEAIGGGKEVTSGQFMLILKQLRSEYAHVRAKCLQVVGECMNPGACVPCGRSSVFELVQWHGEDRDARVRETVLGVYERWAAAGAEVGDEGLLCEAVDLGVRDCEAEVVVAALRLAVCLGKNRPETVVGRGKAQTRLVDRAFSVAACAMSHPCARVRKEAAAVLGSLGRVSEALLLGTLEKTVMVDRVIHRSAQDRAMEANRVFWLEERLAAVGGAEEALAIGGSAGAVVYGLEDDYHEVRLQTVTSVGALALLHPRFALACQDLLVDMLTDDIEAVRAAAVANLSLASGFRNNMTLRADQLDIILSGLDDRSGSMRRSLHALLAACRLASAAALLQLLSGLLRNLARYDLDRDSIWRCCASVGRHHPQFVAASVDRLLRLHPYLLGKQGLRSDPEYVCVLLLVAAAARALPHMRACLPAHVREHLNFLEDLLLPHLLLLPPVAAPDRPEETEHADNLLGPPSKIARYTFPHLDDSLPAPATRHGLHLRLLETVAALRGLLDQETPSGQAQWRRLQAELRQVSRLCPEARGLCLWLKDLGRAASLCGVRPLAAGPLEAARALCSKMALAYTGLTAADKGILESLAAAIDCKTACLRSQDFLPTRETKEILSCGPVVRSLAGLTPLGEAPGRDKAALPPLERVSANQLHPTSMEAERSAVRFVAGLSVCVPVRAEVRGLDLAWEGPGGGLAVRTPLVVVVRRPDGLQVHWQPPDHCWSRCLDDGDREEASRTLFLDTEVPLSLEEWSEPGLVEVGLGVLLGDIGEVVRLTSPVGVKLYPVAASRAS